MRALVVTNMYPRPERPAFGSFVRDQVEALRRRGDVEVELFSFGGDGPRGYPGAALAMRRRFGRGRFDVVHAHFGLTAWPTALAGLGAPIVVTLHGNDLFVPKSRAATLAALHFVALAAAVSREFAGQLDGAGVTRRVAVLPCGVDLTRFRPIPRAEARAALGLDPGEPCLLFPHDPSRPLKRYERAEAAAGEVRLLTLGSVPPERVPLYINAANAVLVPSQAEGFGLAVLEALACEVPVLGHAGRNPPAGAGGDRGRGGARMGRTALAGRAGAVPGGEGPAHRRRPRPRRVVLLGPDGRPRRRGLASACRRTPAPPLLYSRPSARPRQ